jgi:hypothetical protein
VPAAAWVALLGGALVLTASVVVMTNNWDALGRSVRLAVLTAGVAAVVWASERLRHIVPTTAGIVAHVGTFLTVPFGIAAVSLFGGTWPYCLVVGGVAGALLTEFQAERWRADTMRAGQIVAVALASTGLGAITSTTGGLIAALGALGFALAGAHRRAMVLASLALFSPLVSAFAGAGVGVGTLTDAGLYGDRLIWSAPLVGLIAAAVFGIAATRVNQRSLWSLSIAASSAGAITGVIAADSMTTLEATIPGVLLLAAELAVSFLAARRRQIGELIVDVCAAAAASITLTMVFVLDELSTDDRWPSTAAFGAIAIALSLVSRRKYAERDPVTALVIAGALGGSLSAAILAANLATPSWSAVVFMAVGSATALLGARWQHVGVRLCGLGVGGIATIAWIEISGLREWLLDELAPYDFTANDLTMALLCAGLLFGGRLVRRSYDLHSWVAYGTGLVMCSAWLINAELAGNTAWALPTALTVGIVATALGAWHRLAGPLVIGTALTVVAVILSSASTLGALPNWVWLTVGGLGLLVLAALIERGGMPGKTELRLLMSRWG